MPPTKITLVRPDGSILDATPEQAEKLKLLGYKSETPEEMTSRVTAKAEEDHYTSGEQQFYTGLEGLAGGATAGLSDYVFGDENTQKRAQHNPGVRMATEIAGAIGVEFVPGLNAIAPAAVIGRGARAAVKGSGFVRGAARGAIEGAVFGGAQAADHAYLAGDPVTAEAVTHGIGMGALFGGVLGGVSSGLTSRGAKNVAAGEAQEAAGAAAGRLNKSMSEGAESLAMREAKLAQETAALRKAELHAKSAGQFEIAPGSFEKVAEHPYSAFKVESVALGKQIKQAVETVEAAVGGSKRAMAEVGLSAGTDIAAAGKARAVIGSAFRKFSKSLNKKNLTEEGVNTALKNYKAAVAQFANKAGVGMGSDANSVLMNYAEMKLVQKQLGKLPHTAQGFARMGPEKAEQVFAAIEQAKKLSHFPAASAALDSAASKMQEALGLKGEGVAGLRGAWKQAQQMVRSEKTAKKFTEFKTSRAELAARKADLQVDKANQAALEARMPKGEKHEPTLLRKGVATAAGFATYKAGAVMGHPLAALGVASKVRNKVLNWGAKTPELMAARQQTLGRIKMAVGKMQGKAGKVMSYSPRAAAALSSRLDGTIDDSTKDKKQLAYNRIQELAQMSSTIKDTAFRIVEPIALEQPDLAPAVMKYIVESFTALRSLMPSDPGVVSGLKSIWRPSELQAAVMSKQIATWQDPVGIAEEMLTTNQFDPISIQALKTIAPATYNYMRAEMLGRVQNGILDGLNYKELVAIGTMLDIPVHSSMKPEYIAASQALHNSRNAPLPSPQIPGSQNGGRPADQTPGATGAQISEAR